jgi:hypothetical protein
MQDDAFSTRVLKIAGELLTARLLDASADMDRELEVDPTGAGITDLEIADALAKLFDEALRQKGAL